MRYCIRYHHFAAGIVACLLIMATPAMAQQQLLPDQNPRYQESMALYLINEDSLTAREGETVQKTYKAYQFMEAKREWREQKRQARLERRARGWDTWGYPGYSYGYGYPGYSFGYGYPAYGFDHYRHHYGRSSFDWHDLATATTLAMGAYWLFR
ncbi:hypothetical protein HHL17_11890 [Chitinophaga sp. G-6-1-13]|uniref:Uncharacterized protein n=1 Tax=Chitinophaga fulva TaxID=2728842 RepID=A0A848GI49_9BACT|nr:hypothetical protein [Chitinophaga fulva]NML37896.1 hypothetical protein [Chitinophaga fulva]